jgi:deacetoxycephalosporin-C synthase/deacetoxycephalosporin-C hydroxylase
MSQSIVPTFSLPELRDGSRQEELCNCLETLGVFYLTGYGLSDATHEHLTDTVMDFFENASAEQKLAVTNINPKIRRGYSQLEKESTARATKAGSYSDFSMAYSVGVSNNLFPSPAFQQTCTAYFDAAYRVARETGKAVLKAVGVDLPGGLDAFLDCDPILRCRYFPDVPRERCAEHQPARMAPHYDVSVVTLIQQTPCANGFVSLQCETKDGYVELPYKPEALIVMCGAVAKLVSNGKIIAANHQIVAPPEQLRVGSSRRSSVFFLRPSADFRFSVAQAQRVGLDVALAGETATFGEWMGGNYVEMRTAAQLSAAEESAMQ